MGNGLSRIGRIEPKGGTRSTYEKGTAAGSKAAPHCPSCKTIFDFAELTMVEQMDAVDGTLFCKKCKS